MNLNFRCYLRWIALLVLFAQPSWEISADAANWYVRQSGNDQNVGSDRDHAFRSIAKAASTALPGDVIFVGAGMYSKPAVFKNTPAVTRGWIVLYADRQGTYTGDKGDVTLTAESKGWAIRVANVTNILFYGITVQSADDAQQLGYAVLNTGASGHAYFLDCSFNNVLFGIRCIGGQHVSVVSCRFTGTRYGIFATDSSVTAIGDRFRQCAIGIYGRDLVAANVDQCEFLQSTSYAIRCDGKQLHLKRTRVQGGNYGIALGAAEDETATIVDVDVSSSRVGIYAFQGDLEFRDVRLSENRIGIYQGGKCRQLSLEKDDTIAFQNNEYAVYSNPVAGQDGTLSISHQDFRNNQRGIVAHRAATTVEECVFGGGLMGVYVRQNSKLRIAKCRFDGNLNDPNQCHYGIYAQSSGVEIKSCSIAHSRYGCLIDSLNDSSPQLQEVVAENHSVAALYLRGGRWTYDGADKIRFRHSTRGVMARNVRWQVNDVATDETCQYPIMDYEGECSVRNASCRKAKVGFYAYRTKRIDLDRFAASECSSYGVRLHQCIDASVTECDLSNNANGIYVVRDDGRHTSIRSSRFLGNAGYGILLTGTSLDPKEIAGVQVSGNRYGIAVNDFALELNSSMDVQIDDNQYGLVCRRGILSLQEVDLQGNETAAYAYSCAVDVKDSSLAAAKYALIGYLSSDCRIVNSRFSDAQYGLYLRALGEIDVSVSESRVSGAARCGIYLLGDSGGRTQIKLSDLDLSNALHGVVIRDAIVSVDKARLSDLSGVGIYQLSGESRITRCLIDRNNLNWAILARGASCDLRQCYIRQAKYGIGLMTNRGTVTNCVFDRPGYGVYLRGEGAKYGVFHTTIANAGTYGIVRFQGETILQNSIVHSNRVGIYDVGRGGHFDHRSNLVFGQQRDYRNTGAGTGEINDFPFFVDAAEGDLHLAAGSPAINAGDDLSVITSTDLDGNQRPSFRGFEMGAYEYMQPGGSLRVLSWDEVAK